MAILSSVASTWQGVGFAFLCQLRPSFQKPSILGSLSPRRQNETCQGCARAPPFLWASLKRKRRTLGCSVFLWVEKSGLHLSPCRSTTARLLWK